MQPYPNELQKEADALFEKWTQNDEGLSLEEYANKYQSNELRNYRIQYEKEKNEALKNGEIINWVYRGLNSVRCTGQDKKARS